MLYYAVLFFVLAMVAAYLGFAALAGMAAWIAKILFFVFLVALVLSFFSGRRSVL
jgi:uncharacterized membrane protein YtjA (UPF0391 family)